MENIGKKLEQLGLRSELLGPLEEWAPLPANQHQRRHARFWAMVDALIHSEPGEYDDLPEWMTENATEQLTDN